jgi:hypothetical protein
MRTDDLIAVLSRDAALKNSSLQRPLPLAAFGIVVSALAFAAFLSVRPDFFAGPAIAATLYKWLLAGGLATFGLLAVLRLRRPEADPAPLRWLGGFLAVLLGGTIAHDLAVNGSSGFLDRAAGSSALACLTSIGWLSLAPLAAMLIALRAGAVTRPGSAGLAAGLAAAGFAACLYALKCTEDSALFVIAWYGLSALLVGAASSLAGRLVLRW